MRTLRGQNFRILEFTGENTARVIAKATTCSITLSSNVEDSTTKDDPSSSQFPDVVSQSWSVSVESLNVLDSAILLQKIKDMQPLKIMFAETYDSGHNDTPTGGEEVRSGMAYISDVTLTFNDRENSVKSIQFTGTGPLGRETPDQYLPAFDGASLTKGQKVRLFLTNNPRVVAFAKSLSFHVSLQLESSTTKDTEGLWEVQEPTSLSFDISTSALVRSNDVINSEVSQDRRLPDIISDYESTLPIDFHISNVSGANNRVKGTDIVSGKVKITQLTINAPNRDKTDYTATLTGFGPYIVSVSSSSEVTE